MTLSLCHFHSMFVCFRCHFELFTVACVKWQSSFNRFDLESNILHQICCILNWSCWMNSLYTIIWFHLLLNCFTKLNLADQICSNIDLQIFEKKMLACYNMIIVSINNCATYKTFVRKFWFIYQSHLKQLQRF